MHFTNQSNRILPLKWQRVRVKWTWLNCAVNWIYLIRIDNSNSPDQFEFNPRLEKQNKTHTRFGWIGLRPTRIRIRLKLQFHSNSIPIPFQFHSNSPNSGPNNQLTQRCLIYLIRIDNSNSPDQFEFKPFSKTPNWNGSRFPNSGSSSTCTYPPERFINHPLNQFDQM